MKNRTISIFIILFIITGNYALSIGNLSPLAKMKESLHQRTNNIAFRQLKRYVYGRDKATSFVMMAEKSPMDRNKCGYASQARYYCPDSAQTGYNILSEIDSIFAFANNQLNYAIRCTQEAKQEYGDKSLVSPYSINENGSLKLVGPYDWCSGFFPGSLWQMYSYTHDKYWYNEAVKYTCPLEKVKWYKSTHDLGFMIYCSFGQAYRLTKAQSYKKVLIQAAKSLSSRYNPRVKAIRSWDWNRNVWQCPVIIDNMLNLELLFWASEVTGDSLYYNIAVNHANTTLKNHFRSDYSSYHVVDYDTIVGNARFKGTHQGYSDASVWSRGQAWGLYGFTMCYRFTKNPVYLNQAERIADFIFGQPNLPTDLIPYWDMKDPDIPNAPRDASAAAVTASALYELSGYAEPCKSVFYKRLADTIIKNLSEHYLASLGTNQGFLLLHSTGNRPKNSQVDVPLSYADYYYLEALLRKAKL